MSFQRNRFSSKQQGMNTRKHRWVCEDCNDEWTERQKSCPSCGSRANNYFPSELEYKRYRQLQLHQKAGAVSALELQPAYPVVVNGEKICTYKADFRYRQGGNVVVEDCKGLETDVFKLKKKLVEAVHGVQISIIRRV